MCPGYSIELARPDHLPRLAEIEREAAVLFEGWQIPASLLAETTPVDELRAAREAGLLWVALSPQSEPVGFAQIEILDGGAHLEEIDVRPPHGRRGIGRALVQTVCTWARRAGHAGVTLTTFRDIPWNAPFYARLGFQVLAPEQIGPQLAQVVRAEAERGLDPSRRVVMRYPTGRAGS